MSRSTFCAILSIAAGVCGMCVTSASAQVCGNPATGVKAESAVCGTQVRISWTNPANSGLVFPKVWRGSSTDFAAATVVYNPGLGGSTTFEEAPPTFGVSFYYWVGADLVGCGASGGVTQSPVTGPFPAGVFTVNTYPAPTAIGTCAGIDLNWQPARDVISWKVVRIGGTTSALQDDLGSVPGIITAFSDQTARGGNAYTYGLIPTAACATTTSVPATLLTRAGPWANVAGDSVATETGSFVLLRAFDPTIFGGPLTTPAPIQYAWTRGGSPVVDGGRISGAQTPTLSISNVRLEDAGRYLLSIQTPCGQQIGVPVVLGVAASCRSDFDQSGEIGVADIFEFLNAWFAGCP